MAHAHTLAAGALIKREDAIFHAPPEPDFRWGETNPFLFNIPEHWILGVLYVVTRPILGVQQDVVSRTYLTRHRDAMRLA